MAMLVDNPMVDASEIRLSKYDRANTELQNIQISATVNMLLAELQGYSIVLSYNSIHHVIFNSHCPRL